MSGVLIGINNLVDYGVFSGSYGSWLSTLPLANLQKPQLGAVARSTDATLINTQFAINLTSICNVRVLALCNHNLSHSALVKVTAYSDSGYAAGVYDSGWISVWQNAFSDGLSGFNDPTPGGVLPHGYLLDTKNDIFNRLYFNWNYTLAISSRVEARYWKVEIDDTTNVGGFVQIGRLFIGNAWSPDYNFDFGQSIAWETETKIQSAINGTPYFDVRKPTRSARFTLSNLSQIEAMQVVFGIFGYHGIDKEVYYIQNLDDVYDYQRSNFLGRFRQLSEIEHPTVSQYRANFEIKEFL